MYESGCYNNFMKKEARSGSQLKAVFQVDGISLSFFFCQEWSKLPLSRILKSSKVNSNWLWLIWKITLLSLLNDFENVCEIIDRSKIQILSFNNGSWCFNKFYVIKFKEKSVTKDSFHIYKYYPSKSFGLYFGLPLCASFSIKLLNCQL